MLDVVIGMQYGDEGKGRIVNWLLGNETAVDYKEKYSVCARFNGSGNAGHTVYRDGKKFVLHQIPTGVLYDGIMNIIGNGCVIDPYLLMNEILDLRANGIIIDENNLKISSTCHVITSHHKEIDDTLGSLGTTKKGVGPCYSDKYSRTGTLFHEFLNKDLIMHKYFRNHKDMFLNYEKVAEFLRPFIYNTPELLNDYLLTNKLVLAEGAQGTDLDIDHGYYPYVTSSSCNIGGVFTGLGVSPMRLRHVYGVTKCYSTRVGTGPFITEMSKDEQDAFRDLGGEFGATTGRPRRVGWLDMPQLRKSQMLNGFTHVFMTKLDVMDEFLSEYKDFSNSEIVICDHYLEKNTNDKMTIANSITHGVNDYFPLYKSFLPKPENTNLIDRYKDVIEYIREFVPLTHVSAGVGENDIQEC